MVSSVAGHSTKGMARLDEITGMPSAHGRNFIDHVEESSLQDHGSPRVFVSCCKTHSCSAVSAAFWAEQTYLTGLSASEKPPFLCDSATIRVQPVRRSRRGTALVPQRFLSQTLSYLPVSKPKRICSRNLSLQISQTHVCFRRKEEHLCFVRLVRSMHEASVVGSFASISGATAKRESAPTTIEQS